MAKAEVAAAAPARRLRADRAESVEAGFSHKPIRTHARRAKPSGLARFLQWLNRLCRARHPQRQATLKREMPEKRSVNSSQVFFGCAARGELNVGALGKEPYHVGVHFYVVDLRACFRSSVFRRMATPNDVLSPSSNAQSEF